MPPAGAALCGDAGGCCPGAGRAERAARGSRRAAGAQLRAPTRCCCGAGAGRAAGRAAWAAGCGSGTAPSSPAARRASSHREGRRGTGSPKHRSVNHGPIGGPGEGELSWGRGQESVPFVLLCSEQPSAGLCTQLWCLLFQYPRDKEK